MDTQADTVSEPGPASAAHRDDRGASLVEYALLVALIAMVCIAAVAYFGTQTGDSYSRISSSVEAT